MKFFLLAGVAAATLMAQAAEAVTFSYTGSIVQWIVPTTGNFRIVASGAQGGFGPNNNIAGGQGVTLAGTFALVSGQQLSIAVGGIGQTAIGDFFGGGGGGGSFVLRNGSALLIAGGGGGSGRYGNGLDANTGTAGVDTFAAQGGQNGQGGGAGLYGYGGGGGAGIFSSGSNFQSDAFGGSTFPSLSGGAGYTRFSDRGGNGGFGGGGGGHNRGAGGGGGGYSGGAGSGGEGDDAGGGGSFNGGSDQQVLGFNTGDGSVSIAALAAPPSAVPEPSVWSMLISGFGLVGFALRRRLRTVVQGG